MRHPYILTIVLLSVVFAHCSNEPSATEPAANAVATEPIAQPVSDQQQIQTLVRKYLVWANSDSVIDLLPIRTDSKDSVFIGYDLVKLQSNLQKLEATGFFAAEFADDYNRTILNLDKKFKEGNYDRWQLGELPPFGFANAVSPWTLNQDVPYDSPNPWEQVEVAVIKTDGKVAEAVWRWGKLPINADISWKEFTYRFKASKDSGKWKITYLQGFRM